MTRVILSAEQAQLVSSTTDLIELVDPQGNVLGVCSPLWNESEIQIAQQRAKSDGPWLTTAQVLERLKLHRAE